MKPNNKVDIIAKFKQELLSLSYQEKTDLYYTLIEALPKPHANALYVRMRELVCMNLLKFPPEILFYILTFLDAASINRLGETAKLWQVMSQDPQYWKQKFFQKGWQINLDLLAKSDFGALKQRPKDHGYTSDFDHDSSAADLRGSEDYLFPPSPDCPDERIVKWKSLYRDRFRLQKNWDKGEMNKTVLEGHLDGIYCLQFHNQRIITGSRDMTVKVWDLATSECVKTLEGHTRSVLCLQFDSRYLITGSSDSSMIVWDATTFEIIRRITGHTESVLNLAFDSKYLLSASKDRNVKIWNVADGSLIRTLTGHFAAVNAVVFRDNIAASASGDRSILIWELDTGKMIRSLIGHTRGIACLSLHKDTLASGSSDGDIRLWNVHSGECLASLTGHTKLVRSLQFDGTRLISTSYDKSLKIWDVKKRVIVLEITNAHSDFVYKLQFNNCRIVTVGQDRKVAIWDFTKGVNNSVLFE